MKASAPAGAEEAASPIMTKAKDIPADLLLEKDAAGMAIPKVIPKQHAEDGEKMADRRAAEAAGIPMEMKVIPAEDVLQAEKAAAGTEIPKGIPKQPAEDGERTADRHETRAADAQDMPRKNTTDATEAVMADGSVTAAVMPKQQEKDG